uniref:Uncharacterized protein n=1 Tax=Arundo donax TaxID=35708 RepID=A0A0A9BEQ0_ARUDO
MLSYEMYCRSDLSEVDTSLLRGCVGYCADANYERHRHLII